MIKIGTIAYAIHKQLIENKSNIITIRVCKVKTHQNKNGKMIPVLKEIGSKDKLEYDLHHVFYKEEEAYNFLSKLKS